MGRKITMQATLDIAEPEAVFNILFGDDEFMKRYHKKINSDPHAEASSWSKDQSREVKYVATMEGPKMMTKLIGESFPVKELQRFLRDGDRYVITCAPTMESPSANLFVTEAETILAPASGGGCAVTSTVTLEYRSNWFQGPVESFMEARARTGFDQWLALARLYCQEKLSVRRPLDTKESDDNFFDAAEDAQFDDTVSSMSDGVSSINRIISKLKAAFSTSTDGDSSEPDSQSRGDSVNGVEQLAIRVLKVEDDLYHAMKRWKRKQYILEKCVEQMNVKVLKMEGDLASAKLSWEQQQCITFKRRQSALIGAGFATGLTAGIFIGYLCLRGKRQNIY